VPGGISQNHLSGQPNLILILQDKGLGNELLNSR